MWQDQRVSFEEHESEMTESSELARDSVGSPFVVAGVPTVLPRGPHGLDREVVMASQRGRLLSAFVEVAAEKGYNAVTIADIVRKAGTAKRTFYEHFADKEDCFVQAFDVTSQVVVSALVAAADPVHDPIRRIEVGVQAYLDAMRSMPYFAKLFLTESIAAGPMVADRWMNWIDLLAEGLISWRNESRVDHPEVPKLTKMQAVAVLSAINELLRFEIRRNGVEGIPGIADELIDVAVAFLTTDVVNRPRPR